MKRTRLKRGQPLKRKTRLSRGEARLERRTRLAPVNRERKARRHERDFGAYADIIRALPCDLCGSPAPSDPHHAKSRGAGGDKRHLVPACRPCHRKIHDGHGPDREHLMRRAHYYWTTYGGTDHA